MLLTGVLRASHMRLKGEAECICALVHLCTAHKGREHQGPVKGKPWLRTERLPLAWVA